MPTSLSAITPVVLLVLVAAALPGQAQQLTSFERDRGRMMLNIIKDDLKEHYYDAGFHGRNLDESFKAAEEKIKQAISNSQVFTIIAQSLLELNDSHTFFVPPPRGFKVEYGWKMQVFGDNCYVSHVKPGSDAEAKGLKPGDLVQMIDGFYPNRGNSWVLRYLFRTLSPRSAQRLIVQSPGEKPRQLEIASKVKEGQKLLDLTSGVQFYDFIRERDAEDHLNRHRYAEFEKDDLLIWKMPQFDLSEKGLEDVMGKVKKYKFLILDLRSNGGGYVDTLRHMVGYFLGDAVKIGDVKGRKESKPMMSKKIGGNFEGKLVVLVDSDSASAAEVFSRMMQLHQRAVVIGDRSAGSVMISRFYGRQMGTGSVVFYGTSITEADTIMTDGKSLERVGVTPDELLLPKPEDLASGKDPVLSRAAALLGITIDPQKAGTLFPIEWPR